ncbi:MAG: transposase [Candidatus Thiodiazotropha sp. (ex Dulcina madagascariensis)]|nr:transposase [Candidatus Thiodiazotropha sp. (ex Dulcina madagascariensis)]
MQKRLQPSAADTPAAACCSRNGPILIEKHFNDMLRVAVSIKLGKISPSMILRRLGTYSRKNKLYFAFRELGYRSLASAVTT